MVPFRYGDYSAIRRRYLPPDYRKDTAPFNIVGTVYVETEWDPRDPLGETRYAHELAAQYGVPNAIVAQAWLDREDVADILAEQARFPLVRSVRHKPRASASEAAFRRGQAGSMDDVKWRDGFALLGKHGLRFDLQVPWWHFEEACALARDFPGTSIIVNHTGLPADRSDDGLRRWRDALALLADCSNVALKISGIGLRATPWRCADNAPIVRAAIATFGVDRCMFASNFPVDSVVTDFATMWNCYHDVAEGLAAGAREKLFHDNAMRVYAIEPLTKGK
jgi:predicted TIM-barrel fold metal-dependent hydrolase